MRPFRALSAAILFATASPTLALEIEFPLNARQSFQTVEAWGSVAFPVSAWTDQGIETTRVDGETHRQAWQILAADVTTSQLMAPMRKQLVDAGFDILFECEARECGGFDFRYSIDVLPEPEMHVDLGDFWALTAAQAGSGSEEHIGLLVSRSAERGFIQVTRVSSDSGASFSATDPIHGTGGARPAANPTYTVAKPVAVGSSGDIEPQISTNGRAVLADLSFQTGSSELADQPFSSLSDLAEYLRNQPDANIVLVGHTDTDGALSSNVSLSKKRAAAVRRRLAETHGIANGRMRAEGVGYLAPLTTNATEVGRTANRRVEVILTDAN